VDFEQRRPAEKHTQEMADQNYEIDIEPGRDEDEMQVDSADAAAQLNVNRKGRGFGNGAGEGQLGQRNSSGRLGAGNPAHSTAVRCMSSTFYLLYDPVLRSCLLSYVWVG
jgi:hypothetical protein